MNSNTIFAPDAGTYWYHSHNRSWKQVAKGLYGPLIVEELTPLNVDHDLIVLIDDWRMLEDGTLPNGFENMHDQAHYGRLGNFACALIEPVTPIRRGESCEPSADQGRDRSDFPG